MSDSVLVLGANGVIGSGVVRHLAEARPDVSVVAGDVEDAADAISQPGETVSFEVVDVTERRSLEEALSGVDVVVNCVGPFHRFGSTVLEAAIESEVAYLDVCDDYDTVEPLLSHHQRAVERGTTAVVGLGASPGVTNVLVSLAQNQLDAVTDVSINVTRSILARAGPAIPYHVFNSWLGEVPTYTDGERTTVRALRDGGRVVEFPEPFGRRTVYHFGHPESLTLPRSFDALESVSVRGTFIPAAFRDALLDMDALGLLDEEPVSVAGTEVQPVEFAAAMLERIGTEVAMEAGEFPEGGAIVVDVEGERDGVSERRRFAGTSTMQGATSKAVAIGVEFLLDGKLSGGPGVWSPEAVVPPEPYLGRLLEEPEMEFWAGSFGEMTPERFQSELVPEEL